MAVKNFSKSLAGTNKALAAEGKTRQWVVSFWHNHTSEGKASKTPDADMKKALADDQFFIYTVVCDIQRFVFGDEGDKLAKVPAQPASESEVDGWLGAMTLTRMKTWLDFCEAPKPSERLHETEHLTLSDFLVWGGKRIPVEGVKIVSLDEPGGLSFPAVKKGYSKWPGGVDACLKNPSKGFATGLATDHWDVCFSAPACFRVLSQRGLSSTFGIDNPSKVDGEAVVYQWNDPGLYYGYHGGTKANKGSVISFDYSNAVYTKYAEQYKERTGIERPVIHADYHGRKIWMLGMYKAQILAGLRIKKAVSKITGLPLVYPVDAQGKPWTKVYPDLFTPKYKGAHTHLHITTNKWDVAGLPEQTVILLLEDPKLQKEFPSLVECFRLHDKGWAAWLDAKRVEWTWTEVWSKK